MLAGAGLFALGLVLALAGCQTTTETLESARDEVEALESTTIGNGDVQVDLLLHLSGSGKNAKLDKAFENAARLAAEDLGGDKLKLVIQDTGSSANRIASIISAGGGSDLLIVPGDATGVSALSTAKAPKAPIIAMGPYEKPMAVAAYWFAPSPLDQLTAATDYASRALGRKLKVVIVAPDTIDAAWLSALRGKIARVADRVDSVSYIQGQNLLSLNASNTGALKQADAILITDDDPAVSGVMSQLNELELSDQHYFVVRGDVADAFSTDPEFFGALAAVTDTEDLAIVAGRYREKYSSQMPVEAAYVYDAVAVAAGLSRLSKDGSIPPSLLQNSKGFNGASGSFRFLPDGQVERIYEIVRLGKGSAQTLEAAPAGF